MPKELQPTSTLAAYSVGPGPNREANLVLAGGVSIPYVYNLSVRSTVPYVRLLGGSFSQKIISWNESVVVPAGEMVTVYNASFHGGNIIFNTGTSDYSAVPSRITVPIPLLINGAGDFLGEFPLDCRRARRAYLGGFPSAAATPITGESVLIEATNAASTFPRPPSAAPVEGEAPGLTETRAMMPVQALLNIPLGIGALQTDTVHTLLDNVTFVIPEEIAVTAFLNDRTTLAYVLEYT